MAATSSAITVVPATLEGFSSPVPVLVAITDSEGSAVTAYTAYNGSTEHDDPARVEASTTFWFVGEIGSGPYTVTCTTDAGQVFTYRRRTGPVWEPALVNVDKPLLPDTAAIADDPDFASQYAPLLPWSPGAYYANTGVRSTTALTVGQANASAIVVGGDGIDKLATEVTTQGTTGALLRMSLYSAHPLTGLPHALLADGGTVASDTTGTKEVSVSVSGLRVGQIVWRVVVAQVAGCTVRSVGQGDTPLMPAHALTQAVASTGRGGLISATTVTGAMPSRFPVSGSYSINNGALVAVRAAWGDLLTGTGTGQRLIALGDSITAVTGGTSLPGSVNFAMIAAAALEGRVCYVRNAGVGGNNTTQMVSRFAADVTAYTPNIVTIQGGTNDANQSVTLATFQANIQSLVTATTNAGATPIVFSVPPNTGATGGQPRKDLIAEYNGWLIPWCTSNDVLLVDAYDILNDPDSDTNPQAQYDLDGTHPSYLGQVVLGEALTTVLATIA